MSAKPVRLGSLSELRQIKKELDAQAKAQALAAAHHLQAERLRHAQCNLFQAAIGKVQPLSHPPRANLLPTPPAPIPQQQILDEAQALREAISDEVDISTLIDTDEGLSFRRPGIGPDVVTKLRRGTWSVQQQIDLHGLRTDEAREVLGRFIASAHQQGLRCVRVVHGKGLGSPGKAPVLKDKVRRWLVQKNEILAYVQATPAQGGAGALMVLLQPARADR
jgi:DNA-nicking Smr family endonuclease